MKWIFRYLVVFSFLINGGSKEKPRYTSFDIYDNLKLELNKEWTVISNNDSISRGGYVWWESRFYINTTDKDEPILSFRVLQDSEKNNEIKNVAHNLWFKKDSVKYLLGKCPDENLRDDVGITCEKSQLQALDYSNNKIPYYQKEWCMIFKTIQIHVVFGSFNEQEFESSLPKINEILNRIELLNKN